MKSTIISLFFFSVVVGCAGIESQDTIAFQEDPEVPDGPGLFSGETGEFTLYSSEEKQAEEKEAEVEMQKCTCRCK